MVSKEFKNKKSGENLNMEDVENMLFNTLQATQHTMLKKRLHLENLRDTLCDQKMKNAIGQRKFEYKECYKNFI